MRYYYVSYMQYIDQNQYVVLDLDVGGEIRAIEFDISKTFDKVKHAGLLHKLKTYDVRVSIHSTIEFFLQSSTPHGINAGVPHGSILGPTLFLVMVPSRCYQVT